MWHWIIKHYVVIVISIGTGLIAAIIYAALSGFLVAVKKFFKKLLYNENLFNKLGSEDIADRESARKKIIKKGKRRKKIVGKLEKIIINDQNILKKRSSAYCLLNIGQEAIGVITNLILTRSEITNRDSQKIEINKELFSDIIKDETAGTEWIENFVNILGNKVSNRRNKALIWLIGESKHSEYIWKLIEFNKCQDPDVEKAAISALGKIGTNEAVQALKLFLENALDEIIEEIIFSLDKIPSDESLHLLEEMINNRNYYKQYGSLIRTLGMFDTKSASNLLIGVLLNENLNFLLDNRVLAAETLDIQSVSSDDKDKIISKAEGEWEKTLDDIKDKVEKLYNQKDNLNIDDLTKLPSPISDLSKYRKILNKFN